jgi:mono/diheme cytochrome c family protein
VRIADRVSLHYFALIAFFAMGTCFGILAAPTISRAQSGKAATSDADSSEPKKVVLPDGDGKAIAEKSCSVCHELTNLMDASKSEDEWHDTVQLMIERGAKVPKDKLDTLIKYLAKNFGTEPPAAAAGAQPAPGSAAPPANAQPGAATQTKTVELPDGEGKAIATASCQACHRLTNLTNAHKSMDDWRDTVQLMMDRGAEVAPDKVKVLVEYLAKNFGLSPSSPSAQ